MSKIGLITLEMGKHDFKKKNPFFFQLTEVKSVRSHFIRPSPLLFLGGFGVRSYLNSPLLNLTEPSQCKC